MIERRVHHSPYELLQQDRYTPEEVAEVLRIGLDVERHAAFTGWVALLLGVWGVIAAARLGWLFARFHRHSATHHAPLLHVLRVASLSFLTTVV